MRLSSVICLASAVAAGPTTAMAAQQAVDREGINEIVVTGKKETPEEARRKASAFVSATGVAAGQQPAARWVDPICPRVLGLPKALAAKVEGQVRAIAADAGAPLSRPACDPNLAISFTADAGGFVRRLAARAPSRFAQVAPADKAYLLKSAAPVRWWYSSEMRTKDGMAGASVPLGFAGTGEGGRPAIPSNGNSSTFMQYRSSIVSTQMIRAIRSATVVIDVNRATGLPLDSVAAYAAMVGLAEVRLQAPAIEGSLLGLFTIDGPRELSERDLAFLRGLYRMPLDRLARQHRGKLVRSMLDARAQSPEP
jgi:hypothetical protein